MGKEKRYFKRYKRRISCSISFDGSTMDVETVDYSISGISAVLSAGTELPQELNVALKIPGQTLNMYGRVAWRQVTESDVRVGIELIGPIEGSLEIYRLSDLLIGLQRTKKIGTLEVDTGSINKKIYIKNGDMVYATSNQDADRLGDVLLSKGRITAEQYDRSVELMKKTGKKQGASLVELGFLRPRDLFIALKHQVEKIIVGLFRFETGNFHFSEGPLPLDEVITLNFSAAKLIYKGIKNINDEDYICGLFPTFKTVFRLSPDPLDLFQDINLDADDRSVLACVDGKRSIKDILSDSSLGKVETLRTLYMLYSANIILDMSEMDSEEFDDDLDVVAEVEKEVREKVGEQTLDTPQEIIDRIENLYGKIGGIGHYELFGLKENASMSDIKKAYYQMAKEFHPDMHFYLPDDMKDKLTLIFTYLTSAYSTLNDPERKKEYDVGRKGGPKRHAPGTETARKKFDEGMMEMKKGRYKDAAELFGQASYINKSESEYCYYYGLALYKLGKFKEAEKEIRNALRIDPMNSEYLSQIGHIYLELGFPLRAKGNFEKVLRVEPANKRALAGMKKLPPNVG